VIVDLYRILDLAINSNRSEMQISSPHIISTVNSIWKDSFSQSVRKGATKHICTVATPCPDLIPYS